jgi:hypothetical protein
MMGGIDVNCPMLLCWQHMSCLSVIMMEIATQLAKKRGDPRTTLSSLRHHFGGE